MAIISETVLYRRCNLSCLVVPSTPKTSLVACLECRANSKADTDQAPRAVRLREKGLSNPVRTAAAPIAKVPTSVEELASVAWLGASASPQASNLPAASFSGPNLPPIEYDGPPSSTILRRRDSTYSYCDTRSPDTTPELYWPSSLLSHPTSPVAITGNIARTIKTPSSSSSSSSSGQFIPSENAKVMALQWNLNGIQSSTADLERLIARFSPTVLALQELKSRKPGVISASLKRQFHWLFSSNNAQDHRAALAIASDASHSQIYITTELDVCVARVKSHFEFTAVSIYVPPTRTSYNLSEELRTLKQQLPVPFIILGDFNAHHPIWGDRKQDKRSKVIIDWIAENDLTILNNGRPTFIHNVHGTCHAIDLSLASSSLAHKLSWLTLDDGGSSDHLPIIIDAGITSPALSFRPKWKLEEADWENFRDILDDMVDAGRSFSADELSDIFQNAMEKVIPKTSGRTGVRSVRWWSPEVKTAVKARRKSLRKLRKLPIDSPERDEANIRFKEERSKSAKIVREAKLNCWRDFADSINPSASASDLWKSVNSLRGKYRKQNYLISIDGIYTDQPATVAEHLADVFEEASADSVLPESFRLLKKSIEEKEKILDVLNVTGDELDFNRPFSMAEFIVALSKGKGKSTGPDGIGYQVLQKLPLKAKVALLGLFNQIWNARLYPDSWRESIIIPIPKPGSSTSSGTDYRPISLLNCTAKVMERLVNRRLSTVLEERGLLDHRQHAFRQGRGTSSYFSALDEILEDSVYKGKHAEIISLDLSKAYDRTWRHGILQALAKWGIVGNLGMFVLNFLKDRYFRVFIGATPSSRRKLMNGVPQGSVLSVTLFIIAMNSIFEAIPRDIYVLIYADDILLISISKYQIPGIKSAQRGINGVTEWAKKNGFLISAGKSKRIHVCRKARHRTRRLDLMVDDVCLPKSKTMRILGVTLDQRLYFKAHIGQLAASLDNRFHLLGILGRSCPASRSLIRKVGKALIDSRIFYGIELFGREGPESITILRPTYNRSVRAASGALPSSPIAALMAEAGEIPFELKAGLVVASRTVSFLERTSDDSQYGYEKIRKALGNALPNCTIPEVCRLHHVGARAWNITPPRVDWSIRKLTKAGDIPARSLAAFKTIQQRFANHQQIFTDGSKADDQVGVGATNGTSSLCLQLPPQCSIFSAEAAAINLACNLLRNPDLPAVVFTDSASCLQALQSGKSGHPWIQALEKLGPPANVTLCWVPAHCGIKGNEKADLLANQGRASQRWELDLPAADYRWWFRKLVEDKWAKEWFAKRDLFLRKIKPDTGKWTDSSSMKEQRALTRLRIGHTRITHEHYIKRTSPPICDICSERLTVEHLLLVCPKFHPQRSTHNLQDNIKEVLANDLMAESNLIAFLKSTGLLKNI